MISETDYLQHIQQTFPGLALRAVKINRDGMVNVSVIVNQERVFRFPRAERGIALLRSEANALDLLRPYVELPIPDWDYRDFDPAHTMVSYPFIPGAPLLTDDLLRMSGAEQDHVAATLGRFLRQMHSIPMTAVRAAQIGRSDTVRTVEDWLQFYEAVQAHLFPLMWEDGREWVRRHFAPLLADHSLVAYEPCFMNGDLAAYHLLFDQETNTFTGIIDFGTAGIGDPATDFCTMINQYGESFVRRMAAVYPEIGQHAILKSAALSTMMINSNTAWLLHNPRFAFGIPKFAGC